jgi:protocatechuate 3,4-dioxygenase beta subunit
MEREEQRQIVWAVMVVAALVVAFGTSRAGAKGEALPGMRAPSSIVITRAQPGEQALLVEGQVVRADGRTPAAGVVLYVYQTDASGYYSRQRGAPPRLRGWMRTNAQGRYAYRTIRPAPYPQRSEPAHIHTQLWGHDAPPQWGTTLLFGDDPLLRQAERNKSAALGRFAYVCAPRLDAQGVAHCRHDLLLELEGDTFEPSTQHGLYPPSPAGGG